MSHVTRHTERSALPQTFFPKRVARSGFEVTFKCQRGPFRIEGNVSFESPRPMGRRGSGGARVMIGDPLAEISGEAGVAMCWVGNAGNTVHVEHVCYLRTGRSAARCPHIPEIEART